MKFTLEFAVLAVLVPQCFAAFSVDHDLYSTPPFVLQTDTKNYILEENAVAYVNRYNSAGLSHDSEAEVMKIKNETYICILPVLPSSELASEDSQDLPKWEESQLLHAKEEGVKKLAAMNSQCIYYVKDWWTYYFCYGKDIRQFHMDNYVPNAELPEPGPGVASYILGKFSKKKNGDPNYKIKVNVDGDANYLSYTLRDGTTCDLTQKDRSIEVQFYCSPDTIDSILWIKEIRSCEYQIALKTAKICNDPVFAPPKKVKPRTIKCQRVLRPSEVSDWEAKNREEAAEQPEDTKPAASRETSKLERLASIHPGDFYEDALYNELDFSNVGPMKRIHLDPKDLKGKNLKSYLDDTDFTLTLLMEKVSDMIHKGMLKNANGQSIGVRHEFKTSMELLDLDGETILFVRITLINGDLLIEILEDDDSIDNINDAKEEEREGERKVKEEEEEEDDDGEEEEDDEEEDGEEEDDENEGEEEEEDEDNEEVNIYGDLSDIYEDPYIQTETQAVNSESFSPDSTADPVTLQGTEEVEMEDDTPGITSTLTIYATVTQGESPVKSNSKENEATETHITDHDEL